MSNDEPLLADAPSQTPTYRLPLWRRILGDIAVVITALLLVLYVLGWWNPWNLVVLTHQFGNPMAGLFLVPVVAFIAFTLRWPVQNEARQRGRIAARVVAVALALAGLLGWGILGQFFQYETSELAVSPDGSRKVVEVTNAWDNRRNMRVWDGRGLTARETGVLGLRCGGTVVFVTDDLIQHSTGYGDWQLALDPDTGEPQQVLGPRCPDGPRPATLEE